MKATQHQQEIQRFDAAIVKVMPLLSAEDRAAVEAARAALEAAALRRSSIETFLYAAAVARREELAHA